MDPIMTYFLNKLPKASRPRALNKLLHLMMTSAILSNATFYESGTLDGGLEETATPLFQCAAVVLPPGKQVTEFGIGGWIKLVSQGMLGLIWKAGIRGLMKVLVEYPTLAEKIKKTVLLENEPYYYLLIIGTGSNHRGKGLAAAVIRKHQVIAQKKGLPMYLEGSNEGAAKVYEKCGFEHVKEPEGVELVVGKGKCDANGEKASGTGAVGVRIYPMIWWPEGYARGKVIQDKLAV
jgi:GNAT superfamily N-acetyltransferase